jgi:hypothetical protein
VNLHIESFQEQVFFSTVRITIPQKSGIGASIGTGFIFMVPIDDESKEVAYMLISNRHVFGSPPQPIYINFHKRSADGDGPELGQVVPFLIDQYEPIYVEHPDSDVDLACINITITKAPVHNIFYKVFSPEAIADFSEKDLLPGADVWFVGYPENRYDTSHNLPILRRGYIASIPKIDFNSKKQFIIDAQVYPGSSGSPVCCELGGKFKLIGVVTETMIRLSQLQIVPTHTTLGIQQFLGLGIVIKSTEVRVLIDQVKKKITNLRKKVIEYTQNAKEKPVKKHP